MTKKINKSWYWRSCNQQIFDIYTWQTMDYQNSLQLHLFWWSIWWCSSKINVAVCHFYLFYPVSHFNLRGLYSLYMQHHGFGWEKTSSIQRMKRPQEELSGWINMQWEYSEVAVVELQKSSETQPVVLVPKGGTSALVGGGGKQSLWSSFAN